MKNKRKRRVVNATLIVNPVSGVGDRRERRKEIQRIAKSQGWVGEYIETTKTKTAKQIAKDEVDRGVKHLVVCGGDGTIMEVLEIVMNKKVALGIVPLGTGNLLARNLSLPLDTEEAMKIAFFGNHRHIDVGRANNTYFSIIAGIGFDAEVMQSAKRELKDKFGLFAYVITAFKNLQNRAAKYEVQIDNKKPFIVRAKSIMASNMGRLVGNFELVPSADPQSGSLQLAIIKARTFGSWLNIFLHGITGKIDKSPHFDVYKAKHVEIKSLSGKRFYQSDGNHFPPIDSLSIDIFPKAVIVFVNPDEIDSQELTERDILLFDFDGTIGDSLEMVVSIYNSLADKHGYPQISQKEREELRGLSAKDIIARLPISKFKLPLLYAEGKKEFNKNFEFIKPFPDIPEIMLKLSKKYTLGIVTSNDPANVKKFLLNHKMDYFKFIYSDGSLFGKGKIIKDVLEQYKFNLQNTVYVGDEVRDIDAARDAGIRIVSVTWGFNTKKSLKSHKPDFLIESPTSLLTVSFFKKNKK